MEKKIGKKPFILIWYISDTINCIISDNIYYHILYTVVIIWHNNILYYLNVCLALNYIYFILYYFNIYFFKLKTMITSVLSLHQYYYFNINISVTKMF